MATKAISTYKTYLMHATSGDGGGTYEDLVPIKDYPDLGGSPEQLETTDLQDAITTYINGLKSQDALEFTINYTKENFTKLKALENKDEQYAVYFGDETGKDGKFKFAGQLSVTASAGETNAVREAKISISVSSEITFE